MSIYVDINKKLGNFNLNVKFNTDSKSTALFGLSGSGKSVTLKCIAGIIKPDSGKIVINGKVLFDSDKKINLPPQKRNIVYLPQNYALFPNMNIRENICCGLYRFKSNERKSLCDEYIKRFKLEDVAELYPHQISGGQQQRVALARALATKPKLLLLDEPFSALDAQLKLQLELDMIDTLKEFEGSVIFVSHNKDEVCSLCESVCVINDGISDIVKSIEYVLNNPLTKTEALLSGIENIGEINSFFVTEFGFKVKNTADELYKQIGIKSNDIKINPEKCDILFEATIKNTLKDPSNNYIILQADDSSKPLIVAVNKNEKIIINSKVKVGINYSDIHYLK